MGYSLYQTIIPPCPHPLCISCILSNPYHKFYFTLNESVIVVCYVSTLQVFCKVFSNCFMLLLFVMSVHLKSPVKSLMFVLVYLYVYYVMSVYLQYLVYTMCHDYKQSVSILLFLQ